MHLLVACAEHRTARVTPWSAWIARGTETDAALARAGCRAPWREPVGLTLCARWRAARGEAATVTGLPRRPAWCEAASIAISAMCEATGTRTIAARSVASRPAESATTTEAAAARSTLASSAPKATSATSSAESAADAITRSAAIAARTATSSSATATKALRSAISACTAAAALPRPSIAVECHCAMVGCARCARSRRESQSPR